MILLIIFYAQLKFLIKSVNQIGQVLIKINLKCNYENKIEINNVSSYPVVEDKKITEKE